MGRYGKACVIAVFCVMAVGRAGAADHADRVSGTYGDAAEVTADCLSCHGEQGDAFIQSAHWLWTGPTPFVIGHGKDVSHGKKNLMNNF